MLVEIFTTFPFSGVAIFPPQQMWSPWWVRHLVVDPQNPFTSSDGFPSRVAYAADFIYAIYSSPQLEWLMIHPLRRSLLPGISDPGRLGTLRGIWLSLLRCGTGCLFNRS
jgi:hypothetical protein